VIDTVSLIVGITALCMLSPGPDMVLVMQSTLGGGRKQGLLTSLGVLTGNLVHIGYCSAGVGYVIAHSPIAYSVLRYASAGYLTFLGVTSLRSAARSHAGATAPIPAIHRGRSAYARGITNNLLNPKGALFYLGVFGQVIKPGTSSGQTALLVLAMLATSAAFWLLFVSTLHLQAVRNLLTLSRRGVDTVFGGILLLLAVQVARDGVQPSLSPPPDSTPLTPSIATLISDLERALGREDDEE